MAKPPSTSYAGINWSKNGVTHPLQNCWVYYSQIVLDPQKAITYTNMNWNEKVIYRTFVSLTLFLSCLSVSFSICVCTWYEFVFWQWKIVCFESEKCHRVCCLAWALYRQSSTRWIGWGAFETNCPYSANFHVCIYLAIAYASPIGLTFMRV